MSATAAQPGAGIVVVDDSGANVLLLQRLLQSWGYERVTAVTDSSTVLDVVAATDPDLVVLDLHMPAPDGYTLLPALTRSVDGAVSPPPPVLVLTADATRPARDRALELGARDFLTKPLDPVEVRLRVANLLDARTARLALGEAQTLIAQLRATVPSR